MGATTTGIAAAILLVAATPARAETIGADTTWLADDGIRVVADDLLVAAGATLEIRPGVRVELAEGAEIRVEGALIARGTDEAPILLTGQDAGEGPARWGSVHFADSAVDAVVDPAGGYVTGSVLDHVVLEHGARALWLEAASPLVRACTFRDNLWIDEAESAPGGAAVYIGTGSAPWIVESLFEDNAVDETTQGGAIYADFADPIILRNTFRRNTSAYGGALTVVGMASPIAGNLFEDNEGGWEGGAMALVSSISAILDNEVRDNHSVLDGGGVHICVDCFPHANPLVMDNTITGNTNDFHGAAGFGAAYLRVFRDNNLHDNTQMGAPADFGWWNELAGEYPEWVTNPDISGNWWGTTDRDAIAATVHDGRDESGIGLATWEPFRDGPVEAPSLRVTITTRKIVYDIEGEPMPVFLTIYNPGAARELELLLTVEYPDGPPLHYRRPLTFAGATVGEAGFHSLDLPAGGLLFETLVAPAYARHATTPEHGTWRAVVFDRTTGERIGEACSARFELEGEVLP